MSAIIGEGVTAKFKLFLLPWKLKMIRIGWKVALVVFKGEMAEGEMESCFFCSICRRPGACIKTRFEEKEGKGQSWLHVTQLIFYELVKADSFVFSFRVSLVLTHNVYHDHPLTIPPWTGTMTNMTIMTTMTTMTPMTNMTSMTTMTAMTTIARMTTLRLS